ncbi:hypothetical protein AAE478_005411 [Parahypoxylon ruwenzoriense]
MPPRSNTNAYSPRDTSLTITKVLNMVGIKTGSGSQGHAYIILQVIRCSNVAVLFAVIFVSILMMVFAKMPNGYQFFNDVSLAFVSVVAGVLIWSELPVKAGQQIIKDFWPVLGDQHGFTWLGISMILMGSHHLGALSRDTYMNKDVPFQIWQAIMGSGIIAIAFGVTNIFASIVFKNRNSNLSARQVRINGATTENAYYRDGELASYHSSSIRKEKPSKEKQSRRTLFFGKGDSKPKISHPIVHDLEYGATDELPIDDRSSPIIPDVKRPPTALHPAYNAGSRSSRYSEASHLDRFDNRI